MMEAVVDCIRNSKHGLIESPTGTGKTLSILCAAVAAVQKSRVEYVLAEANRRAARSAGCSGEPSTGEDDEEGKKEAPAIKIIFCTRTHSQIEQIFNEMKAKLPYALRVSPFASRKHSCIFEDLSERYPGNALNLSC